MNNKMYYQWKAEGICVLCGKKPAVPGMIYCATCREKELKRKRILLMTLCSRHMIGDT